MKKMLFAVFLILFRVNYVSAFDFEISSDKLILVNLNEDKVLYASNDLEKTQIASLTKIATAITVIDNVSDLTEEVVITADMFKGLDGYAKAGLKVGDKVTILDLLYALMLPSGADAANALAISVGGSIDEFVLLMNKTVSKLNLDNTHFSNPIGMDDVDNYSTAKDLYILLDYSLNNPTFRKIYETRSYYLEAIDDNVYSTIVPVAKKYNLDLSIIKGSKTGHTDEAGFCFSSIASINGVDYLLINLNAPIDNYSHILDALNIYNYYGNNYKYQIIKYEGELLYTLKINGSKQEVLNIYSDSDISLYLNNNVDVNKVNFEYEGVEVINKNINKGDKLGVLRLKYNKEILYEKDIYLNEDIVYYDYSKYVYIYVIRIGIISLCLILLKCKKQVI